jgi:hypothetical protein
MPHITWELPATLAAGAALLFAALRGARALRDYAASRTRRSGGWPAAHRALGAALILLAVLITVPAFVVIYITVTSLLYPYMGIWSWTVPVCGEIAFAFLFGNGILLALRRAPGGGLRAALMAALMAGSVILNVYAARHVVPSAVGHVVVVVAFFGVMLAGKATVMTLRGGKVRADRITPGEWIAQPVRSAALWRWMKTWGEPSRDAALERYMQLLFAVSVAQASPRVGCRSGWRKNLPLALRYQLATGLFPQDVRDAGSDWQEVVSRHVTSQLTAPGTPQAQVTSQGASQAGEQVTPQGSPQVAGQSEVRSRTDADLKPELRRAVRSFRKSHPGDDRGIVTHVADKLGIGRDRARRLVADLDASGLPSLGDRREARNAAVR